VNLESDFLQVFPCCKNNRSASFAHIATIFIYMHSSPFRSRILSSAYSVDHFCQSKSEVAVVVVSVERGAELQTEEALLSCIFAAL